MAVFYFSLQTSIVFLLYFCKVNLEEQYYHLYELTLYLRVVFCWFFFFPFGFFSCSICIFGGLVWNDRDKPQIDSALNVPLI